MTLLGIVILSAIIAFSAVYFVRSLEEDIKNNGDKSNRSN